MIEQQKYEGFDDLMGRRVDISFLHVRLRLFPRLPPNTTEVSHVYDSPL